MTNLKNVLVIAFTLAVLSCGLFLMSLLTEVWKPGSGTQVLTTIAYGVAIILSASAVTTAVFGFMYITWRQFASGRHVLEISTERGTRYFVEYPADRQVDLLDLSGDEVRGIELGSNLTTPPRVRRVPESRPTYVRAKFAFPTAAHDPELLLAYQHSLGGNGK